MSNYDRSVYENAFASLLDLSLKKGGNDPVRALKWLNRPLRYFFAVMRSRHRLETTDAFLDVREHLEKRMQLLTKEDQDAINE